MAVRRNIPRPSGGERVWVVNPTFLEADVTGGMAIGFGDTPAIDPFGRLRTSEPFTVFNSKQLYDKVPLFFDEEITNNSGAATSTHSTIDARVRMEIGGADDQIIRQTFERFNYQPGKGQLAFLTFNFLGPNDNTIKEVGLFDDDNGMFLRLHESQLSVVIRKNGEDFITNQENWNLDKLDGEGISGINLDTTKVQILVIDYEWLGVGRVRFGFVIDGLLFYVHQACHANVIYTVYTSTPNLPVRYNIEGENQAGEGALDHICATVISEGGYNPKGKLFTVDSGGLVTLASANTTYGILALRLRATHLDLATKVESWSSYSSSAGVYYLHGYLNPTLGGGAWAWADVDSTYSGMQYADGGNGVTISGGVHLFSAIISGRSSALGDAENERNLGAAIDGTRDILALCIEPLTNNQDVGATLNWREA